jgi:hypothetical protein
MDQYIVRLRHASKVSGWELHAAYHGPYATLSAASAAADALDDHYRTWPMHVDGQECRTGTRVVTLMPPPRLVPVTPTSTLDNGGQRT